MGWGLVGDWSTPKRYNEPQLQTTGHVKLLKIYKHAKEGMAEFLIHKRDSIRQTMTLNTTVTIFLCQFLALRLLALDEVCE